MNCTSWTTTMTRPQPRLLPQPAWSGCGAITQLNSLAGGFDPISLKQMDGVALLNRIDTKFVMTTGQMLCTLAQLQPDYWMLAVKGQRLNHYRTLYFDTSDFALYHAHVNERPERYKVRSRKYTDSQLSFLEVKHRTRKDRTIKERIRTSEQVEQMNPEMATWLNSVAPLDGSSLKPKLWNTFSRLTLVSKQYCERVTLDVDLSFSSDDKQVQLDGIAIAEVKMDSASCNSPFLVQMLSQRIRQRGFSKYAMGIALLYDGVKKNSLKPKMLWLDKMMIC